MTVGMRDSILFIGMGDWDLPQLDWAREAGFRTVATNRNPKAQCLAAADEAVIVDGKDIQQLLAILQRRGLAERVAYVYTGTELFSTASLAASALGVAWHKALAANACENKDIMSDLFRRQGIPHPAGFSGRTVEDIAARISFERRGTWIVKPVDSLSSQGVMIVGGIAELPAAVGEALRVSISGTVVCEEYIRGSLHDVNGIISEDGLIPLGINDKLAGPPPGAVVVEGSAPSVLSAAEQLELYRRFEAACRAVGLGPGPVKGDFIRDGFGELLVMEVAPRLHGPLGSIHLLPNAVGVAPFVELMNYITGRPVTPHDVHATPRALVRCIALGNDGPDCAAMSYTLTKEGKGDRAQWRSNNDVPKYGVQICEIR